MKKMDDMYEKIRNKISTIREKTKEDLKRLKIFDEIIFERKDNGTERS